jgi:alkylation response protein AidB-like acyl-CoA dehydrogenase
MNFELSEEQAMLQEALQRLLADRYSFETRRRLLGEPQGWSRALWADFAELGLLAAPFAEADGGLGGGAVESMVVAERLGASLVAEPYFATVVLAGSALRFSEDAELRAQLVPPLAAGELILAFADDEPAVREGGGETRARRDGDGWRLDGVKRNVIHGDSADRLVVTAQTEEGPGVFLVDAAATTRRGYRTFDGLRAADVRLEGAPAAGVLALGEASEALVERTRQSAIAFLAAEATGLMDMLLEVTLEHLRTRRQFGRALAEFQALQHRAAEMLVALEQARSMAIYAAMMIDDPDTQERRKACAAVKAVIGTSGRFVGENAVQLHGGLGVSEEHRAGWGLRRLTMIDLWLGDAEEWTAELARLGGFVASAEAERGGV